MNLKYYKKDLEKFSLYRGLSDEQIEVLVEEFWDETDRFYEEERNRCQEDFDEWDGDIEMYYWFDKNTGEYYIGNDYNKGRLGKPPYYGKGVIGG